MLGQALWLTRVMRIARFANQRDDRETYRRAAGLLARIYREKMPIEEIARGAAEMAGRYAELAA